MSFAKFCCLLERKELFFALVADMEDRYEGFIYPPIPREHEDRLQQEEQEVYDVLRKIGRTALISCWTESGHESSLMWETYADADGVAVRTTFQHLQESIHSVAELPVTFGQIEYVDYRRKEVARFGWAPLFHKRMEYRGEGEVRAVLPGPLLKKGYQTNLDIRLDPDVAEQRGRYIPVNLEILVQEIVLPPHAAPWFAQIVKSVVHQSPVRARVTRSAIESPPAWPQDMNDNILYHAGSPARAGIDPPPRPRRSATDRFPRTRGDRPPSAAQGRRGLSVPPHARG